MRPKLLAIDWSGGNPAKGIAVAVLESSSRIPELLPPPNGAEWKRTDVLELLKEEAESGAPTVAGIDCNFALPFSSRKYIPRVQAQSAPELWLRVEEACCNLDAPDLYAKPFVENYQDEFWRKGSMPVYLEARLRITEKAAEIYGLRPASPLNLIGPSVGMAGLSGMRLLHKLKQATGSKTSVWPFEKTSGANLTLVEIYPAVHLLKATGQINKIKTEEEGDGAIEKLNKALRKIGCKPNKAIKEPLSEHVSDALVSVAGMADALSDDRVWILPESDSGIWWAGRPQKEGWIFGVPWPEKGC